MFPEAWLSPVSPALSDSPSLPWVSIPSRAGKGKADKTQYPCEGFLFSPQNRKIKNEKWVLSGLLDKAPECVRGWGRELPKRLWSAPPHLGDNLLSLLSQPWPTGSVTWVTRGHRGTQSHLPVHLSKTDSRFYRPIHSSSVSPVSRNVPSKCLLTWDTPFLSVRNGELLELPALACPSHPTAHPPLALTSASSPAASLPQASPSHCQVLLTYCGAYQFGCPEPIGPSTLWTRHRHCRHSQHEVITVPLPPHFCLCWGFLPVSSAALGSQVHTTPTTQEPFPPISLQSSHLGQQLGWTALCPASCLSTLLQAACSCFLPVDARRLSLLCSDGCLGEVVPELSVC